MTIHRSQSNVLWEKDFLTGGAQNASRRSEDGTGTEGTRIIGGDCQKIHT